MRRLIWVYLGLIVAVPLLMAMALLVAPGTIAGLPAVAQTALWSVPGSLLLIAFLDALRRLYQSGEEATVLEQTKAELEVSIRALQQRHRDLAASEQRFRGLVEAQGDVILRRTPDGRLTFVNDAFCMAFGVARDAALGRAFQPESHPGERLPLGAFYGQNGMPRVRYDQRVRTKDGWRWFAWEDYVIRSEQGHVHEVQSVGRDITEQKQLEAALREARDNAEQASKAKTMFLAMMSHEIRTPMNGVLGMAGLLVDTRLTAEQRSYAVAVRQSGEALLDIINDILDFSKIESGALELEETSLDPRQMIESVAELLSLRAADKGIEVVTYAHPDAAVEIAADEGRVRQVLLNLTGNAIKFTDQGGVRISVVPDPDPRYLRFEVADSGVGIAQEAQDKIFEVFMQADNSLARKYGGTGLGLAISQRLVRTWGGDIGVTSTPGRGSRFWFTLPFKHRESEDLLPPEAREPELAAMNILVLTQFAGLSEAITRQLNEAGAEATAVRQFAAAEEALAKGGVHVFLCDNRVQGMGAEEMRIRLKGKLHGARTLVLIPPSERPRLDDLRKAGYDGYLIKPVRRESLIERIVKVMRPQDAPGPRILAEPPADETPAAAEPGEGLRVLMAEDNRINVMLATKLLTKMGHRVDTVGNGKEALEVLARAPYDLILMDVHMPEMDGLEATRRIRRAESAARTRGRPRPRIPIVALTANAMEGDRKVCLDAGMDEFLTKPLDPAALQEILARYAALSLGEFERARA